MHVMSAAPVIVISGLPGVGKSTTARALALRFDRAAHVEADKLQDLIVAGAAVPDIDGVSTEAQRQLDLRLHHASLLAQSFADAGFTAIVDDIVIGDTVDALGVVFGSHDVHFVMLLPDFACVKKRWIDLDSPFADSWDWIDDVIRNRTTRIGLWLDTTDLDVDQTVDAILDHVRAAAPHLR